ncbi:hypothetical protein [Pedobacter zeae]|uniref:Chromosomal replication initiator DnaA C-terminal domain-containing protein n=1 Tax=Pedobacter zeae TaxID=1737356 RepID=A0A7W6K9S4_9SPHI|nr:hypothetical protein [Pedobacter zeae]MBB4106652.1 hypothetical protein [Pedobacter zeae]GGH02935.1 hypothetical protein GCM10007422_17690 [Pedobacter zeae]
MHIDLNRVALIRSVVAQVMKVNPADLNGCEHRKDEHKNARALFTLVLFEEGLKPPQIAREIGKTRWVVYYRIEMATDLLSYHKTTKKQYLKIIQTIENED